MHTRERVVLVTVRVTTLRGGDAGLYYVERIGDYYVDRSEPSGVWHGQGAQQLGLTSEVDDEAFLALMDGRHPDTDELLGRRYGERSVRGFDVTASAPKAVSVLFAVGDEATRRAVLEAHDAAVAAMVAWVEAHAHTRYRVLGEVMTFDAQGIVAASFRQHTSRALDPQLHTHVVIPNRVLSPDGRWLALDARTIKVDQRTLSAVYHAGLRAELTRSLGVAWRQPEHGIAELRDVPEEVLEEFSSRTAAMQERIEVKLERFVETLQRQPTPRERWRLEREAVLDSRPSKSHEIDAAALHREWAERALSVGHDPARIVAEAVGRTTGQRALAAEPVTEQALEALAARQSAWRPAELVRELAAAVPTDHAVGAAELLPRLDRLAEEVAATALVDLSPPIPPGMPLRRDGRPITEAAVARQLTTPAILAQEEGLVAWAERRLARGGDHAVLDASRTDGLDGPQREVAAAVAGTQGLVLVVGPAGTGKTTALGPAVAHLREQGRPVFGVAPSAAAAEVLALEAHVPTDTVDKLLVEHSLDRPPEPRYDLPAGTTLIVDEAAMVPTDKLAELARLADRRGWRVPLVGDPLQFSAVGRSGMFAHLVGCNGAIELDRVRRFAAGWERQASLRMRRGEADVLALYDAHGRLHGGTRGQMERAAVETWWAARERGEQVAMMAATNEAVERLNHRAQEARLRAGELDARWPSAKAGGYRVFPGDEVATRRNDRKLRTDRGHMVKNRDRWHAKNVLSDGSLTVTGRTGTVILPPSYVAEHLELAYAQTSHANQGRTVDRSLLLVDGPTDSRGVYVPMTRGRLSNEAFVVVTGEETARDVLERALVSDWIDRPALARRAQPHLANALDGPQLRELFARRAAIDEALTDALRRVRFRGPSHDDLVARREELQRRIVDERRAASAAREFGNSRSNPFRRRQRAADVAWATTRIRNAEAAIEQDTTELATVEQQIPAAAAESRRLAAKRTEMRALAAERDGIDGRLRQDRSERITVIAVDPPAHVVDRLGDRPQGGPRLARWDEAAARIDQHAAAYGGDRDQAGRSVGIDVDQRGYLLSEREISKAVHAFEPKPFVRGTALERGLELGIDL